MNQFSPVMVTGIGVEIPGFADVNVNTFLEALTSPIKPAADFYPEQKLGKRGLRYKDRATKLALCSAQSALKHAGLPIKASEQLCSETFGVIVSSNLSNLDSVCRVLDTIRIDGVNSTSSMDLPNASSNVVATSIAISFGLKGLNLMVCNGATSGLDALYLAANAIRAGRASRMLVVGVETNNAQVVKLLSGSVASNLNNMKELRIGEVAGAVLLESVDAAAERGTLTYGSLEGYGYHAGDDCNSSIASATRKQISPPDLWLPPNCTYATTAKAAATTLQHWTAKHPVCVLDLGICLGETYGALGVLQCIAACLWLQAHEARQAIATSGACWGDGNASMVILNPSR